MVRRETERMKEMDNAEAIKFQEKCWTKKERC